ncbi:winged helix-turn-helix domain-containing tetratricopeptide repeat protein [Bradyrhizobium sp. LjRoot220]|uniref:winged helix-turn-helix domain-containing tetratricopeptide repeat protein n=1 Tax=Bradyrhizobium sp. LjRoot220 TaxID=3342284 RepID=UPI003ED08AF8
MRLLFSDYVLDTARRELRCGAQAIEVEPQVLDLLVYLIQNRDRVVTKDDLIDSVWGGRIVSDTTLTSRIYAARRAVGDSGRNQQLIRTIARKGLRFIGDVRMQSDDDAAQAIDPQANEAPALAQPAPALPDRPAIAVLPFSNMSDDPEQEYFSDGISEDIITALSKLRWFFVIARNSSFMYKGKAVHVKQIGEDLGVGYVLEGSVRKHGGRLRITAQLNDVANGSQVWAERYDRDVADVFVVQDEITEAIVGAIEPQLYAAENIRIRRKPPSNMDAWDLVMRGLSYYWRVTRQDHAIAQDLLEQAIAIEPHYGQALGMLSASYTFGAHMAWLELDTIAPVAERTALAAVRADSEDAWAHYALGGVYLITRRFDDSIAEFELALRLNPNFSQAQNYYAAALGFCGRWQEAIGAASRAIRLSPRDPFLALCYGSTCLAQFMGRNYQEAMQDARTAIRLRSDYAGAHRVLTAAAGMSGDPEAAAAALGELRRAQPDISLAWIADHVPIKHDSDRVHYLEGFRRAGLD